MATQQELNSELASAAEKGNLIAANNLLAQGADINGLHCLDGCRKTPLMMAALNGHLEVVRMLLENGADTMLLDSRNKTAGELADGNDKAAIIECLNNSKQNQKPDQIAFCNQIGNRTRADIYDFTMRERVTLIRQGKYGPVETTTITGFSAIEDQSDESMLRKAFNEHVNRGGKVDETAVFPNRLPKARLPIRKN